MKQFNKQQLIELIGNNNLNNYFYGVQHDTIKDDILDIIFEAFNIDEDDVQDDNINLDDYPEHDLPNSYDRF